MSYHHPIHCCHCGRFSMMLSKHNKWGCRIDYSYCAHCRTLDRIGREYYLSAYSPRKEYFFDHEYEYMEEEYFDFLYGDGA